jgi:hypothetical protein
MQKKPARILIFAASEFPTRSTGTTRAPELAQRLEAGQTGELAKRKKSPKGMKE